MNLIKSLNKITDTEHKNNYLNSILDHLKNEFNLIPVIGVEIEFYLSENIDSQKLAEKINLEIKLEKGKNQFEIDLPPSSDITTYANQIISTKDNVIQAAKDLNGEANFTAKPFINDYGNSLHIHLNFLNDDEINIEKYANILCHFTKEYLNIFLPRIADLKRLNSKFMAPTHICHGGNNRTCMIRIPDSLPRRLEHRLPSASSDPYLVITAILESILRGARDPSIIQIFPKIHGNAFDSQYNLEKINSRT